MEIRPNIKLKTKLLERGISQRNLAFGIEVDEAKISKIIRGYERPTPEIKTRISDFIGARPEELFIN